MLRSAATHFSKHGYAGASTRAILSEAGATAPALYHHFGNKTGLYIAAAAAAQEHVLSAFTAAIADHATLADRMSALLAEAVALRQEHPNVAKYLSVIQQDTARHAELSELDSYEAQFNVLWQSVAPGPQPETATAVALRAVVEGLLAVGGAHIEMRDIAAAAEVLRRITRTGLAGDYRRPPV
ncbi:TetR/AcrR family transcriptional regulator [Mycobacterium sp.]|uniref:TetR/AcrR family transcriptional regulator n=1 Tax=Mycobacterium sp. TaxID=1785 RepID=UPI0025F6F0BF|nr:TetR/AcrR family transcriptional regulator [Mycobacterium sp.]